MSFDSKIELHRGFHWPISDKHCRRVVFDTVSDMIPAVALVGPGAKESIAFQAGGNCGVWALWLADRFKHVYTAEPEPVNFECLSRNIKGKPVTAYKCGVSDRAGGATIDLDPANMGAGQLELHGNAGGSIQIRTIDSLLRTNPSRLGFLCLDIEGMELLALRGASERIYSDRPVIQIEDKGLSKRYLIARGTAEKWLSAEFGYSVHSRPHRDVILVPPTVST